MICGKATILVIIDAYLIDLSNNSPNTSYMYSINTYVKKKLILEKFVEKARNNGEFVWVPLH